VSIVPFQARVDIATGKRLAAQAVFAARARQSRRCGISVLEVVDEKISGEPSRPSGSVLPARNDVTL
jgi:hypothetical protein